MDSAAWAPIASDTVPRRPAAIASERREKLSCVSFIRRVLLNSAKPISRAKMILVFGIEWVCRRIVLYLRHRNKASLTRATPHRNTPDQCAINLLKHLLIFWRVDLSRRFLQRSCGHEFFRAVTAV